MQIWGKMCFIVRKIMSPCDLRTFTDFPRTVTLSCFLSDCCAVNNASRTNEEREKRPLCGMYVVLELIMLDVMSV